MPRPLIAALVAAAVVAAGCSGDDADGSATTDPPDPVEDCARVQAPAPIIPPPAESEPGAEVAATALVSDLVEPTSMAPAPGSDDLYVTERAGLVRLLRADGDGFTIDPEPVLDLTADVGPTDGELGLLGIAVAPDGDVLYVDHTEAGSGDIVVRAFPIAAGAVDPGGASELLRMVPRCGAHLGGQLLLDDEGNLLIGVGDGDGGRILNPSGSSQDETNLFGSILRVVPTVSAGEPYEIPPDNPFAGEGGEVREEIYVQGVRNPWRFALDPDTGDLWVADLGEDAFEELTLVPAAEIAGANLGWDFKEASRPFRNPDETPDDLIDPQYEYDRDDGCSIIGGVVAEDPALPAVEGGFVFGDLCTGVLRVAHADGGEVEVRSLGVAVPAVVSFGQDRAGRTYVLSLTGKLLRLDPPG